MGDAVQVLQSVVYRRTYKRLHPNQKADVDDAVVVDDNYRGRLTTTMLAG